MPLYEYHCDSCGEDFEVSQRMSEATLTKCKLCGSEGTVKRLMGVGSGVIFKGSGFYSTDYKKSPAASEPATASKSDSKKDSTPSGGGSCGAGCGCHP